MGSFILFIVFFILFFNIYLWLQKKFSNASKALGNKSIPFTSNRISNKNTNTTPHVVDTNNKEIIYFRFRVVGIGFSQKTKDACALCTRVFLKPENNPHDKNAVAVYNQNKDRIGYIPRGEKDFLKAFNSNNNYFVDIVNHYYNEDQSPVNYCELDIEISFCADFEYLKKVRNEAEEMYNLAADLSEIRKYIKDKEISDIDKYNKISILNETILTFNKQAEKVNWVTIPMRETIVLMNKLKLKTQLDFIENNFDFSPHSDTQHKYVMNYIEKHKKTKELLD